MVGKQHRDGQSCTVVIGRRKTTIWTLYGVCTAARTLLTSLDAETKHRMHFLIYSIDGVSSWGGGGAAICCHGELHSTFSLSPLFFPMQLPQGIFKRCLSWNHTRHLSRLTMTYFNCGYFSGALPWKTSKHSTHFSIHCGAILKNDAHTSPSLVALRSYSDICNFHFRQFSWWSSIPTSPKLQGTNSKGTKTFTVKRRGKESNPTQRDGSDF